MSTKDLSRTVIEGGRHRFNQGERYASQRVERAHQRAYLRAVEHDPSVADARTPEPRQPVRKSFADRLAAAERWLLGHVGRPWRKVEGEILANFDTRTVAGRHVVFGHLMPQPYRPWNETELRSWYVHRRTFYVDVRGVLRVRPVRAYRRKRPQVRPEVVSTLGARRVIVRGERLYWLEPTGSAYADGTLAYRQTRELDPHERAWWDALEDHERAFAQTPAVDERARDRADAPRERGPRSHTRGCPGRALRRRCRACRRSGRRVGCCRR